MPHVPARREVLEVIVGLPSDIIDSRDGHGSKLGNLIRRLGSNNDSELLATVRLQHREIGRRVCSDELGRERALVRHFDLDVVGVVDDVCVARLQARLGASSRAEATSLAFRGLATVGSA